MSLINPFNNAPIAQHENITYEKQSDTESCSPFSTLPDELLISIFSFLTPAQTAPVRLVNHRFNRIACDSKLWEIFCSSAPFSHLPLSTKENPMNTYIRRATGTLYNTAILYGHYEHNAVGRVDNILPLGKKFLSVGGVGTHFLSTKDLTTTFCFWDLEVRSTQFFERKSFSVTCISSYGEQFLTGSKDGTISLWQPENSESRDFKGHTDKITCLLPLPHENKFLSGSKDKTVRLWDMGTDNVKVLQKDSSAVTCVIPFENGCSIGFQNGEIIHIVINETGLLPCLYDDDDWEHSKITCLAPFGDKLLSGAKDGVIRLWDMESLLSQKCSGHTASVLCFLPFSGGFLSGSKDATIRWWDDAMDLKKIFNINSESINSDYGGITCLIPFNEGFLYGTADGIIAAWQMFKNEEEKDSVIKFGGQPCECDKWACGSRHPEKIFHNTKS